MSPTHWTTHEPHPLNHPWNHPLFYTPTAPQVLHQMFIIGIALWPPPSEIMWCQPVLHIEPLALPPPRSGGVMARWESISVSFFLFFFLSFFLSVNLSVCLSSPLSLSLSLSLGLSVFIFLYLSVCLSVFLSISQSVCLSLSLSGYFCDCILFFFLSYFLSSLVPFTPSVYLRVCQLIQKYEMVCMSVSCSWLRM